MAPKPNVARDGARAWLAGAGLWLALILTGGAAVAAPGPEVVSLQLLRDGRAVPLPVDARLLRLAPGDEALRVHVRAGAAVPPPRIRFLLQGHDPGWMEPEPLGERLFRRIQPGSYRLRIAWADAAGQWRELPALAVWVEPPWWQGRYALGLFGLLGLVLAALFSRELRARHRRREAWRLTQARQQLAEQHSEAKSRFLATLGHEIRTPMTGVLGMAELLQGGVLDARQRGQVEAIQRAGQHLLRLVNDALDLARIEAGRLELSLAPFALRPLLDEVAGLLRPLAEAKGLGFRLACAPSLPAALLGDATRLRQILFNLGHNAIKFCDAGGISLRVDPGLPEGLVLSVHDSGPGLGQEEQARLFRRFEQGASGQGGSSGSGGSGLGLAPVAPVAALGAAAPRGNRTGNSLGCCRNSALSSCHLAKWTSQAHHCPICWNRNWCCRIYTACTRCRCESAPGSQSHLPCWLMPPRPGRLPPAAVTS